MFKLIPPFDKEKKSKEKKYFLFAFFNFFLGFVLYLKSIISACG
jgi:hypothetical protein